jgi:four helix bundle protein
MNQIIPKYDLNERTIEFSKRIIQRCKVIEQNIINKPIISQLIRSGTSIGANYCEANNASSKKDFKHKIYICKKEAQETKYWLQILAECIAQDKTEIRILWKECQELTMIFQKIINSLNNPDSKLEN